MVTCTHCQGKKTLTITAVELTKSGAVPQPPVEIQCVWCNGTGEMTTNEYLNDLEAQATWCSCGNLSGNSTYYHYFNGVHGWICDDCGRIIQVG